LHLSGGTLVASDHCFQQVFVASSVDSGARRVMLTMHDGASIMMRYAAMMR
jgi:hypothetical protein